MAAVAAQEFVGRLTGGRTGSDDGGGGGGPAGVDIGRRQTTGRGLVAAAVSAEYRRQGHVLGARTLSFVRSLL